jgi:FAD/FMN-containing dehydrogenase
MPDIAAFTSELAGIEQSTDAALLRQKSRDFYWYSPILKRQLDGKRADIWLRPTSEDEVMSILNAARRHSVPVTVRGGATGNYGQCVPLNGGAVLDTTGLAASAMAPCAKGAICSACAWRHCRTRQRCSTWKVMTPIRSIAPMARQA